MDMNIIPIVFAFDRNFVMPACVCITSLFENANPETFYDIFILHTEGEHLECDPRLSFDKYGNHNIHYIPVSSFQDAYEVRGITKLTYYRLLIPLLIPQYSKILYSDVDVIFRNDMTSFYNTDLGDNYIGGVNTLFHLFPEYGEYYKNLNLNPEALIYAGNILINTKKINEDGIVNKFVQFAEKDYTYQDMDVINLVCKGKIFSMPPSFCLTTFLSDIIVNHRDMLSDIWKEKEIDEAVTNGIVHYNGQKPWIDMCPNFDIWWEYYRKSSVFDYPFYYSFWNSKMDVLEKLSLWKRIKVLCRFFVFGRKS